MQTSIILHEDFMKQCFSIARVVKQNLRQTLEKNGSVISDETIDKAINPMMEDLVVEIEKTIRQQDEIKANRERQRQDEVDERIRKERKKEQLEENKRRIIGRAKRRTVFIVNKKRRIECSEKKTKRWKNSFSDSEMIEFAEPEIVSENPPLVNIQNLDNDKKLAYEDEYDRHWQAYMPTIEVKVKKSIAPYINASQNTKIAELKADSLHDFLKKYQLLSKFESAETEQKTTEFVVFLTKLWKKIENDPKKIQFLVKIAQSCKCYESMNLKLHAFIENINLLKDIDIDIGQYILEIYDLASFVRTNITYKHDEDFQNIIKRFFVTENS